MEAAGIEPASENVQQESLHTYQVPIGLTPGAGEPATPPDASPIDFAPNQPGRPSEAILQLSSLSETPTGGSLEERSRG